MKSPLTICLIDGGFSDTEILSNRVSAIASNLRESGELVEEISLNEKKIIPCTGCWGCWIKTPGECLFKDETLEIRRAIINADLVLFASPLILGYPTAKMKHVMDKLIPLIMPYIELVENENHHTKRYQSYPKIGLIYGKEEDTDAEDLSILRDLMSRFALNFKSEFVHFMDLEDSIEQICNQICETRKIEAA